MVACLAWDSPYRLRLDTLRTLAPHHVSQELLGTPVGPLIFPPRIWFHRLSQCPAPRRRSSPSSLRRFCLRWIQVTSAKRKRDNAARFRAGPAQGTDQAVHERQHSLGRWRPCSIVPQIVRSLQPAEQSVLGVTFDRLLGLRGDPPLIQFVAPACLAHGALLWPGGAASIRPSTPQTWPTWAITPRFLVRRGRRSFIRLRCRRQSFFHFRSRSSGCKSDKEAVLFGLPQIVKMRGMGL